MQRNGPARRCLVARPKTTRIAQDTLVIWGGEFGRTPMSEKGDGRDHNPTGFSIWMAGGGVRGGQTIGATDELGLYAVEDKMHVHDIHASILHLLGLNNMQLSYDHKGRIERPTINEGRFNSKICQGLVGLPTTLSSIDLWEIYSNLFNDRYAQLRKHSYASNASFSPR